MEMLIAFLVGAILGAAVTALLMAMRDLRGRKWP